MQTDMMPNYNKQKHLEDRRGLQKQKLEAADKERKKVIA